MITETIVPTKSPDGITFYISADGTRTGISIAGLERLVGLKEFSAMFNPARQRLLYDMAEGEPLRKSIPDALKPAWGKVFDPFAKGADGAKIVMEEAAVCIIEYYAFEKNSEVARHAYRKFAQKGFNTWVKEVTNYSLDGKYDKLLSLIQELMVDVKEMKVKVDKLDRLEGTTVKFYPGLAHINGELSSDDKTKALSSSDLYTAKDWLALNKIDLDKSRFHSFVLLAAETYRTLTREEPKTKYKPYKGKNGRTTMQREGNGYRLGDFHILEAAYQKLLTKQPKVG
ncbi:hypothetical protein BLD44_028440 [Mastigocladus laminosus UU774]|nr:hypothetical protein BLD44_028440 [Mastigocladus laminosus UU774]